MRHMNLLDRESAAVAPFCYGAVVSCVAAMLANGVFQDSALCLSLDR
jgi:hypothetical protein